jgi:hypothetical protein
MQGSKHYVLYQGVKGIKFLVNIDGVGFRRPKVLIKDRNARLSSTLAEKAVQIASGYGIVLEKVESKTGLSDYGPFRDLGVECLWISDHPNPGRETDADVASEIDISHLDQLVGMYMDILEKVEV